MKTPIHFALGFLLIVSPTAFAQRLTAADTDAIESSAAAFVARDFAPGTTVAFDARVRGKATRRSAQVAKLSGILKARSASTEAVYTCSSSDPRSCKLDVDALVTIDDPQVSTQGTTIITVEIKRRTNIDRIPVSRGTQQLIVSRVGNVWKVVGVGAKSIS